MTFAQEVSRDDHLDVGCTWPRRDANSGLTTFLATNKHLPGTLRCQRWPGKSPTNCYRNGQNHQTKTGGFSIAMFDPHPTNPVADLLAPGTTISP